MPVEQREFRDPAKHGPRGKNNHYMQHRFFRHRRLFRNPETLTQLFADIPFLNGGLFECLDTGTYSGDEVRVDGFSDAKTKQPLVPDALFFGKDIAVDLSDAYASEKKAAVKVDGLFHILNAYRFTVTENTPVEEEIALDPELLGRMFENLLAEYNPETQETARNNTGSFYTPRTIVDYMTDLALHAYLKEALIQRAGLAPEDAEVGLEILLAYTEREHPFTDSEKRVLVDAIYDAKILDPACGSGAFPMGVLQKLVYVLEKLDHDHERWRQRILDETPVEVRSETRALLQRSTADYRWKLGLIQHCIYGVDIQPIAVQIAKLRCFISLLVDFDVDRSSPNMGVPSLPNLDFKFVAADTLIRPPSGVVRAGDTLGLEDPFFETFATAAEEYFFVRDPDEKKNLRAKLEKLIDGKIAEVERQGGLAAKEAELEAAKRKLEKEGSRAARSQAAAMRRLEAQIARVHRDIAIWESYRNVFVQRNAHVRFFDPRYFFPEARDNFDIVIGNPPYIQIQKCPAEKKDEWKDQDFQTYAATGDVYCLFYERGAELLRAGGTLCYISSNKWMRAGYGEAMRKFLSEAVATRSVLDFGMAQNFGAATTYTCITQLQRPVSSRSKPEPALCCYASDDKAAMADPAGYFQANRIAMPELNHKPWVVLTPERHSIKKQVEALGTPLEQWDIRINRGVLTGLNEAFYITSEQREAILAKEPQTKDIIVPLLRGRFVERYGHRWDGMWMINTHNGVKEKGIPPVNAIQDYPVIYSHLKQFETGLKKRQDKGDHWTNLRNCAYLEDFSRAKIIYPNMTKPMPFFFDDRHHFFINDKAFILSSENGDLPYLVALFNSSLFRCCFRDNFPDLMGNTYELRKVFFDKIPIRKPQAGECELFAALVDYVQFAKSPDAPEAADPSPADVAAFLESLIDACVMELYFPDHMAEKELAVLDAVRALIRPLDAEESDRKKWQQVATFHAVATVPESDLRDRLQRIPVDSPDLLAIIQQEGKA